MEAFLVLIPLATLWLLPSALLKLAATLSRIQLRWPQCFGFGGIVVAAMVAGRVVVTSLWNPPIWITFLIAAGFYLYVGSWFVASRGLTQDSQPVTRKTGLKVMAVYLGLLAVVIGVAFALLSRTTLQVGA